MIVQRRIFKAKVGQAPTVASKVKEFVKITKDFGWGQSRIYTDYLSGETDRVAWEVEIESLGQIESLYAKCADNAELQAWFGGMMPLIESASVKHWTIE